MYILYKGIHNLNTWTLIRFNFLDSVWIVNLYEIRSPFIPKEETDVLFCFFFGYYQYKGQITKKKILDIRNVMKNRIATWLISFLSISERDTPWITQKKKISKVSKKRFFREVISVL